MAAAHIYSIRIPTVFSSSSSSESTTFNPPALDWLAGSWRVTYSSLPLWKDKRNVIISYEILPPSSTSEQPRIRDTTAYQGLKATDKQKTITGINNLADPGAYDWRGTGWLKIATSHWEVLGFGDVEGDEGNKWLVTYFAKTLFTPAGIDIYSLKKEISAEALEGIKKALAGLEHEEMKKLVGNLFEVKHD